MIERDIPLRRIIPGAQNLALLAEQLEPGVLAHRFGGVLDPVMPHAERLSKSVDALITKYAVHEGEGSSRRRKKIKLDNGIEKYDLGDNEETYEREERAIFENEDGSPVTVRIRFPWLITEAHIQAIPRYLIPVPPAPHGVVDPERIPRRRPVSFAAIRFVMADPDGCEACGGSGIKAPDVVEPAAK